VDFKGLLKDRIIQNLFLVIILNVAVFVLLCRFDGVVGSLYLD
jgi:hypothetical protein